MLKAKDKDTSALNLSEFTDHNRNLFYDQSIPPEQYTPVKAPA
jgi:hypothetical protein